MTSKPNSLFLFSPAPRLPSAPLLKSLSDRRIFMMRKIWTLAILGALLALGLTSMVGAQDSKPAPPIIVFGSDSPERGTTRVGYWDRKKNHGAGQFAIDDGRPLWKKDYEDTAKFDAMTKGHVYRMGSNFWTTLDSDMPLTIA